MVREKSPVDSFMGLFFRTNKASELNVLVDKTDCLRPGPRLSVLTDV